MTKFLKEWKKWISTKPKTRRTSSVSALNYSQHAIFDLVSLLQNNLRKIKLDKSVGRRLSITKYFSSHDCFNCVSDWLREWHKFSANNLTQNYSELLSTFIADVHLAEINWALRDLPGLGGMLKDQILFYKAEKNFCWCLPLKIENCRV